MKKMWISTIITVLVLIISSSWVFVVLKKQEATSKSSGKELSEKETIGKDNILEDNLESEDKLSTEKNVSENDTIVENAAEIQNQEKNLELSTEENATNVVVENQPTEPLPTEEKEQTVLVEPNKETITQPSNQVDEQTNSNQQNINESVNQSQIQKVTTTFYDSITGGKKEFSTEDSAFSEGNIIMARELEYVMNYNESHPDEPIQPDINYFRVYPSIIDENGNYWYYLHFFCQSGEGNDEKLKNMYGTAH